MKKGFLVILGSIFFLNISICLAIAIVFSFSMAIIITNRVEQPITGALRSTWNRFRSRAQAKSDAEAAIA